MRLRMKVEKDSKLYIVTFGKLDIPGWFSFGNGQKPVHVIAKSYDEAVEKATMYVEELQESKSIVGEDGSLNIPDDYKLMVKSVQLACEAFIY